MHALKVLQIAESYPPDYGGGAAIYVRDICSYLARQDHEVRVLCTTSATDLPSYAIRDEDDEGVRIRRVNLPYFKTIDPEGWRLGIFKFRRHQNRIRKIIRDFVAEWRPDIVQYNATRPFGEVCLTELKALGVPVVAMLHEAWVFCTRVMLLRSPISESCAGPAPGRCLHCMYSEYDGRAKAWLKLPWRVVKLGISPAHRLWRRLVARRGLHGAIAYSQFMTETARPYLPGPIEFVPLGINLSGHRTSRPARPRTPFRFGFVAGFQPTKGILEVLAAASRMKADGLQFEIHIWGPGQETGWKQIQEHGLEDRVVLRGTYTADAICDVYSEMDIAIMATLVSEPWGRVVQEAAANGIPTIAPAVGGITEQIRNGVDGLLFKFRYDGDLECQMRRVLEQKGLYEHLCQNLRPVADTREAARRVEEFYYRVLGRNIDSVVPTVAQ